MTEVFQNVYWIGGSPCCGKSSVAELLASEFGLSYYKCDDHFDRHLDEGIARGLPVCSILRRIDHEYIFMRTHSENVQLAFDVFREEFDLILDDLAAQHRPLLVEGCALLPDRVAAWGVPCRNAFYMVPTESFFREQYKKRTWAYDRLMETSDPDQAFENWMMRDVTFAGMVAESAESHDFPCVWIDGKKSIQDTAREVSAHFGLAADAEQDGATAPTGVRERALRVG